MIIARDLVIVALILAACAFIYPLTRPALPHDPTHESDWVNAGGYRDPVNNDHCCGEKECYPLPAGHVIDKGAAGYYVGATGQTISPNRVIWRSPDRRWWLCMNRATNPYTVRCLFGPAKQS